MCYLWFQGGKLFDVVVVLFEPFQAAGDVIGHHCGVVPRAHWEARHITVVTVGSSNQAFVINLGYRTHRTHRRRSLQPARRRERRFIATAVITRSVRSHASHRTKTCPITQLLFLVRPIFIYLLKKKKKRNRTPWIISYNSCVNIYRTIIQLWRFQWHTCNIQVMRNIYFILFFQLVN